MRIKTQKSELFVGKFQSTLTDDECGIKKESFESQTRKAYNNSHINDDSIMNDFTPVKSSTRIISEIFAESFRCTPAGGEYDTIPRRIDFLQSQKRKSYKTLPKSESTPILSITTQRRSTRLKSVLSGESFQCTSPDKEYDKSEEAIYSTPSNFECSAIASIPTQRRSTRLKSVLSGESFRCTSADKEYDKSQEAIYSTPSKNESSAVASIPTQRISTMLKSELFEESFRSPPDKECDKSQEAIYSTRLKNESSAIASIPIQRRSTRLKSELLGESLRCYSPDKEYDKSRNSTNSTRSKNKSSEIAKTPTQRRLTKLKSVSAGSKNVIKREISYKKRKNQNDSSEAVLDDSDNKNGKHVTKKYKITLKQNHKITFTKIDNNMKTSKPSTSHIENPEENEQILSYLNANTGENNKKTNPFSKELQTSIKTQKELVNKILSDNRPQDIVGNDNVLENSIEAPTQTENRDRKLKDLNNSLTDDSNKNKLSNNILSITEITKLSNNTNLQISEQLEKSNNENLQKTKNIANSAKQHVEKVKTSKSQGKKKYTKISKLTKQQIKNMRTRKIPKDRLDNALNMIDNDDHPIWKDRNISCQPPIFFHWSPTSSLNADQNIKLKYAREFLLRRDWISLSKILCLSNSTRSFYYPLLAKYAALLLAHTDKDQFDKFIKFLTNLNDSGVVIKKCTNISKDNEK